MTWIAWPGAVVPLEVIEIPDKGLRRVYRRGHTNIRKGLLIHAGGFNLGLLLRQLIGVGTPRWLQGCLAAVLVTLLTLIRTLSEVTVSISRPYRSFQDSSVCPSRASRSRRSVTVNRFSPGQ